MFLMTITLQVNSGVRMHLEVDYKKQILQPSIAI